MKKKTKIIVFAIALALIIGGGLVLNGSGNIDPPPSGMIISR